MLVLGSSPGDLPGDVITGIIGDIGGGSQSCYCDLVLVVSCFYLFVCVNLVLQVTTTWVVVAKRAQIRKQ